MFRKVLQDIHSRVEGSRAISLMDVEGIAVETIRAADVPLESIGAEFGSFVKSIRVANTELNTGEVEQFTLVTDQFVTFFSAVTSEYFILMVLSRDGNYGRARFELKKAKYALRDELS